MSRRRRTTRVLLGLLTALLVLGTLPVTGSRLVGWEAGPGAALTAFAPLAPASYAATLLLLAGLALAGAPRVAAVAGVVVTVMVGLHLVWLAPLVTGDAPQPAAGAEPVEVMAANLRLGRADPEALVAAVRESGAEILVLSEVTPDVVTRAGDVGLVELLPYRVGRAAGGAAGTLVLSTQPLETIAAVDTLFGSYVVRSHGLTLLGTHPLPPTSPGWAREQREVLAAAREHDVDVVAGDLNATLDHPVLRELVTAGWHDSVELMNRGLRPTWPTDGARLPFAVARIDHVMVRDRLAVTDTGTFELPGTDHAVVTATVVRAR